MKKIEVKKIVSQVGSQKRSRGRPPGSKNIKKKPIKILLQRKQTVQHSPVEEPNDQPGFADLPVEVKEEIVNDENATIEIGSNLVHFYLCRTLCLWPKLPSHLESSKYWQLSSDLSLFRGQDCYQKLKIWLWTDCRCRQEYLFKGWHKFRFDEDLISKEICIYNYNKKSLMCFLYRFASVFFLSRCFSADMEGPGAAHYWQASGTKLLIFILFLFIFMLKLIHSNLLAFPPRINK